MLLRHKKIIHQLKKYANHFSFFFSTTENLMLLRHTQETTQLKKYAN